MIIRYTSENYNYSFDAESGFFARWGRSKDDDPNYAPSPEILDIEISYGPCSQHCDYCYKSNGSGELHNMSFDEFKNIFDKMKADKILTQIAFGITDIYTNKDFFRMMEYSRSNNVIPNYTTSGFDLDDNAIALTKKLCGAIAVSIHSEEIAFNAIKRLTDSGMNQVNIHWVLSEESYEETFKLIDKIVTDKRLMNLNYLVLLAYKPKGRNCDQYHTINDPEKYRKILEYAEKWEVAVGFDSCSAPLALRATPKNQLKLMTLVAEPCESTLFSSYINADGEFYPCSFTEGEPGWETGISVLTAEKFSDVWYNPRVVEFRNKLIKSSSDCKCMFSKICRNCPTYKGVTCEKLY